MKITYESMLKDGDPDGTRKRQAHFYGRSATDAAQQYQALAIQRRPEQRLKARPVDKKTAKFWLRHLFRWIYLWHLMLACIGFWSFSTMSTWSRATDVEYNPEGSPVPTSEMVEAIKYAVWQHQSRYDADVDYIGLTGEREIDGKIIVQWEAFGKGDNRNATARWSEWKGTEEFIRGTITINSSKTFSPPCLKELLVHELFHPLASIEEHSDQPDDVTYYRLGNCRYTLSLSDLQFMGRVPTSCHVEITPDGSLENLDFNGIRMKLDPLALGRWGWATGEIYRNPHPRSCNGAAVINGEIWLDVKSFKRGPTALRLQLDEGVFTSIPLVEAAQ